MKKLLFTFTLGFAASVSTFAQTAKHNIKADYVAELILDYEQIIKNVPEQWRSAIAEPFKKEIKNGIYMDYFLESNGSMSSFTMEQKINNSQDAAGMILQQMTAMEKFPMYKDHTTSTFYKEVEAGKKYLIKDSIPNFKWKITREKADIAGYSATKAEGVMMDSIHVTAWYAPTLPYKDGPNYLSGLPGLIVKAEMETSGYKTIYTLKNLKVLEKDLKINLPTKGQVVTNKQFMDEMLELQKKYKEMSSGIDTK